MRENHLICVILTLVCQEEEPMERMKYGDFARTESIRSLPCLEEELQEPLLNLLPRPR